MEQGVELDALIARMIDNYVSRNRAATMLRDLLDEQESASTRWQTISRCGR